MNSFKNFEAFRQSPKFNSVLYKRGTEQEIILLPTLRTFFQDDTLEPLPDGSHFDFKGKNKFVELKSRSCNRLTYQDTAIGVDKIDYAETLFLGGSKVYFVFQYTDGLYFWEYDPIQKLKLLRYGRIPPKGIPHWFVPVDILTPLIV